MRGDLMRHLIPPTIAGLLAGCAFTFACSSIPRPTVPQRVAIERGVILAICAEYEGQPERFPDLDAFCRLIAPPVEVAPVVDGGDIDDAPHSGDSAPTADNLMAIDPARGRSVRSVE